MDKQYNMFRKILSTMLKILSNVRANYPWTQPLHITSRLLLLHFMLFRLSNQLSNQLFSLSTRLHIKVTYLFVFWIKFFKQTAVVSLTVFSYPFSFECPQLLQSYWCTVIALVKMNYKQNVIFHWNGHGELLKLKMRRSRASSVL